jgi:hypothetical protein
MRELLLVQRYGLLRGFLRQAKRYRNQSQVDYYIARLGTLLRQPRKRVVYKVVDLWSDGAYRSCNVGKPLCCKYMFGYRTSPVDGTRLLAFAELADAVRFEAWWHGRILAGVTTELPRRTSTVAYCSSGGYRGVSDYRDRAWVRRWWASWPKPLAEDPDAHKAPEGTVAIADFRPLAEVTPDGTLVRVECRR